MIVLLLAGAALAADVPAASAAAPANKPKREAKICRTVEVTGTRMGNRTVCRSAADWEDEKRQAEQFLNGRRDLEDVVPKRPAGL
jgi:predicted secreted protein